jgi:hypothetical protein
MDLCARQKTDSQFLTKTLLNRTRNEKSIPVHVRASMAVADGFRR